MRRAAVALICLVARAAALSSSRMPRSPTREAKEANAVLAAAGERLRAGDAEQATRFLATGAPELLACDGRARRRNRSTLSAEGSRGATWIFCGDGSRRRRGCHVDILRRRVAAASRGPRGYYAETGRGRAAGCHVDIMRRRVAAASRVPRGHFPWRRAAGAMERTYIATSIATHVADDHLIRAQARRSPRSAATTRRSHRSRATSSRPWPRRPRPSTRAARARAAFYADAATRPRRLVRAAAAAARPVRGDSSGHTRRRRDPSATPENSRAPPRAGWFL